MFSIYPKGNGLKKGNIYSNLPDTQSTTTRAPSVTRRAAVTSEEKSTWPGESIRLIKKPGDWSSLRPSKFTLSLLSIRAASLRLSW